MQIADSDRDGRVTGQDAVTFFQKSGVSRDVLARVWDMANSARLGYLDRLSFHKAMDLISLAQQGETSLALPFLPLYPPSPPPFALPSPTRPSLPFPPPPSPPPLSLLIS